jgi:hypothetical protein
MNLETIPEANKVPARDGFSFVSALNEKANLRDRFEDFEDFEVTKTRR